MAEEHPRSVVDVEQNEQPVPVAIIRVKNQREPAAVSDDEIEPEFVRRHQGCKSMDERIAAYNIFKRYLAEEEKSLSKCVDQATLNERIAKTRAWSINATKERLPFTRKKKIKELHVTVTEEPAADPLLTDGNDQEKLLQKGQKIIAYNIFQRYLCEEFSRLKSIQKAAEDAGVTNSVMSDLIEEMESRTTEIVEVDKPVEPSQGKRSLSSEDKAAYNIFEDLLSQNKLSRAKCVVRAARKAKVSKSRMYCIIRAIEVGSTKITRKQRREACDAKDEAKVRSVMISLYKNNKVPTLERVSKILDDDGYFPPLCRATIYRLMKKCWV